MKKFVLIFSLVSLASCSSNLINRNPGRVNPYQFNVGSSKEQIHKNSMKSKMLREDAGNFDSVISNKDMNQDENCFDVVDERLIYTLFDEEISNLEFQLQLNWDAGSRFKDLGYDLYYDGKTFYSFFVKKYAQIEDYSIEKNNEIKREFMEQESRGMNDRVIIPHDAFEVSKCSTQEAKTKRILGYVPIFGWYVIPFIMKGKNAISVRLRPRINCDTLQKSKESEYVSNESYYCFRKPNPYFKNDQFYFKLKKQELNNSDNVGLKQ